MSTPTDPGTRPATVPQPAPPTGPSPITTEREEEIRRRQGETATPPAPEENPRR